jgi:hypothetical protein
MEQPDVKKTFLVKSIELMTLAVAKFSDDVYLPIAKLAVEKMDPKEALDNYDLQFGKYNDRLMSKDMSVIDDLSVDENLAVLELKTKFDGLSEEDREFFWTHIVHVAKLSSMHKIYKHIPENVMTSVTEAALDLKTRMDSGEIDPTKVNPFELGQQVMSKFQPEELEKMMKDLMGNKEAMSAMMSQMSSMIGTKADPSNLAALANSQFDISSMMKIMPK